MVGKRSIHGRGPKSIRKRNARSRCRLQVGAHHAQALGTPRGASGTRWPRQHRHFACSSPLSPPMGLSRAENPLLPAPSCTTQAYLGSSYSAPRLFAGKPILPRTTSEPWTSTCAASPNSSCSRSSTRFQRPCVWNRDKQWVPLWDNVQHTAERVLTNQGGFRRNRNPISWARWFSSNSQDRLVPCHDVSSWMDSSA